MNEDKQNKYDKQLAICSSYLQHHNEVHEQIYAADVPCLIYQYFQQYVRVTTK